MRSEPGGGWQPGKCQQFFEKPQNNGTSKLRCPACSGPAAFRHRRRPPAPLPKRPSGAGGPALYVGSPKRALGSRLNVTSHYISAQTPSQTSQRCFSHLVCSCWKPFGAPSVIRNTVCLCNLKLLWSVCSLLFSCQHCPLAEIALSLSSAPPPPQLYLQSTMLSSRAAPPGVRAVPIGRGTDG